MMGGIHEILEDRRERIGLARELGWSLRKLDRVLDMMEECFDAKRRLVEIVGARDFGKTVALYDDGNGCHVEYSAGLLGATLRSFLRDLNKGARERRGRLATGTFSDSELLGIYLVRNGERSMVFYFDKEAFELGGPLDWDIRADMRLMAELLGGKGYPWLIEMFETRVSSVTRVPGRGLVTSGWVSGMLGGGR